MSAQSQASFADVIEAHVADLRRRQSATRPAVVPDEVRYPYGERTLPEYVSHWAAVSPDKPAVVCAGETTTYAALDDRVRRAAAGLRALGVSAGDRVAVDLPNSTEFVVTMLAALRLGAVHVPVNPMFTPEELAYELTDSGAAVLVTFPALLPAVRSVRATTPLEHVVVVPLGAGQADPDGPGGGESAWGDLVAHAPITDCATDLDALAALNYTGGTTGFPKGCQHTQRHMLYTAAAAATSIGLGAEDEFSALCYLPIFWIAGEDLGILLPVVLGGTSVLMARWDAGTALRLLAEHRVRTMCGTVENYLEILDRDDLADHDLSALIDPNAVSFVRKMDPEVRRRWRDRVGSHSLLREASYGLTETNTLDTSPWGLAEGDRDLLEEPVFCGVPVPGTDIVVVDWETGLPVSVGESGEILVRSPAVTTGYWNNPEATAEQLVDGWLHTGDNGRLDEAGCLHYLGRRKEMIKVKGMSVFPAEIEMALGRHPAVGSVAVVPAAHPDKGEQPVAFVTLVGRGVDAATLEAYAAEHLSRYKVPVVVVVDDFPMTTTGKIRKVELEQLAQEAVDARA